MKRRTPPRSVDAVEPRGESDAETQKPEPRLQPGLHLLSTPIGSARDITLRGLDFRAARDAAGTDLERPQEMISSSIAREAVESGRPVMTEDASGDARFAGETKYPYRKMIRFAWDGEGSE